MLSLVTADREVLYVDQTGTYANDFQILRVLSGAPENSLHSGKKLADAKRLGHIVVGSHLQTPDLVVILSFCCKHDDRSVEFLSPDFLADLIAINIRQHEIKNDAIRLFPSQELQSLFPGSRSNHIVTLELENIPEPASHLLLVFYNQDPLHSQALKSITKILFAWKREAGSWIFIGNLCRILNLGGGALTAACWSARLRPLRGPRLSESAA